MQVLILINGLDHIKIQVVGNNDIKGLYEIGNEIDDILESNLIAASHIAPAGRRCIPSWLVTIIFSFTIIIPP